MGQGQVRQMFADQFEQDGGGFIYRKSQKGEAFRVSSAERDRFVEEFDRNVHRATWTIYIGLTVVLGAIIWVSVSSGTDLSEVAIFAGFGVVMIAYVAYFQWAWGAPARELRGRTPVAGERAPEEVRRMRFQRMSYGQLATAALGGVMVPFIGSTHRELFSGWNRLWLVFGGALVLFAALQAFRKWRFEQEDSYGYVTSPASRQDIAQTAGEPGSEAAGQQWRYLLLALAILAAAVLFLTPVGKRVVAAPSFFPMLMIGCGAWALFTVARGFSKGRIEPFVRGIHDSYELETQPKRFWASMAWNASIGCLCLGLAFINLEQQSEATVQYRCYNDEGKYSAADVNAACNQMLQASAAAIRRHPDDTRAYFNQGFANEHFGHLHAAVADFSRVIQLSPDDAGAYYYRWAAYKDLGEDELAAADFESLARLEPKVAAALRSNS